MTTAGTFLSAALAGKFNVPQIVISLFGFFPNKKSLIVKGGNEGNSIFSPFPFHSFALGGPLFFSWALIKLEAKNKQINHSNIFFIKLFIKNSLATYGLLSKLSKEILFEDSPKKPGAKNG